MKHEFLAPDGAPSGFRYLERFLTEPEERAIIEELEPLDWDGSGAFKRRGQLVKRRELDFLHDYGRHSRTLSPGPPLPPLLAELRKKCARAVGGDPESFGQVIAALYRPGAAIDWHIDSTKAFGEVIAGVSLGSASTMEFRRKGFRDSWAIELLPRSFYILEGPARWEFHHRIMPLKALRYSVTLRTLR